MAVKQTSKVKRGSTIKMAVNTKAPKILKGKVPKGTKIKVKKV